MKKICFLMVLTLSFLFAGLNDKDKNKLMDSFANIMKLNCSGETETDSIESSMIISSKICENYQKNTIKKEPKEIAELLEKKGISNGKSCKQILDKYINIVKSNKLPIAEQKELIERMTKIYDDYKKVNFSEPNYKKFLELNKKAKEICKIK